MPVLLLLLLPLLLLLLLLPIAAYPPLMPQRPCERMYAAVTAAEAPVARST